MQIVIKKYIIFVRIVEQFLALIVFFGVTALIFASIPPLVTLDWAQPDTFYEFMFKILLAIIGLELVRMLITHDLIAVLELIAFVIARKMLKPDISAVDMAISVAAFIALVLTYRVLKNTHPAKQTETT